MKRTARVLRLVPFLACGAAATVALAHPPHGGGPGGAGGPMMGQRPQGPPRGPQQGGPQGGPQHGPHAGPQPGGPQHGPGGDPALRTGGLLGRAADADDSHDVTADEWAAFLAAVDSDGDGVVDMDALVALLPAPPHEPPAGAPPLAEVLARDLDADGDGVVTTADLQALFDALDRDADGALTTADAPERERPPADPRRAACLLARAADADEDRATTEDEWTAFFAAVDSDGDGTVDLGALIALLPEPPHEPPADAPPLEEVLAHDLDADGDGAVEIEDLQAIVGFLDRNGDGQVTKRETKTPKLRGKPLAAALDLARAADADASRDVTSDEWGAFTAALVVNDDGSVSLDDLASRLRGPKRGWPSDTERRDALLVKAYDRDGDGTVTVSDLAAVFGELDRDGDGALSRAEMRPKR